MKQIEVQERITQQVVIDPESGCWVWMGSARGSKSPYGTIWIDGRHTYVHRAAYEAFVGPIPDGLTIDHVVARGCTTTLCCRPDHLEPVSLAENIARGAAARITCRRGHDKASRTKWGQCRPCLRLVQARYEAKRRSKAVA